MRSIELRTDWEVFYIEITVKKEKSTVFGLEDDTNNFSKIPLSELKITL